MEELWLNNKNSLILGGGILFGGLILYKLKPSIEDKVQRFPTVLNRQNSSLMGMEILNTDDDNFREEFKKQKPRYESKDAWLSDRKRVRKNWDEHNADKGSNSEKFEILREDVIGGKKRKKKSTKRKKYKKRKYSKKNK